MPANLDSAAQEACLSAVIDAAFGLANWEAVARAFGADGPLEGQDGTPAES